MKKNFINFEIDAYESVFQVSLRAVKGIGLPVRRCI